MKVIFCCQPVPELLIAVMVLVVITVPPPNKVPVKVTRLEENALELVPTHESNALILKAVLGKVTVIVPIFPTTLLGELRKKKDDPLPELPPMPPTTL